MAFSFFLIFSLHVWHNAWRAVWIVIVHPSPFSNLLDQSGWWKGGFQFPGAAVTCTLFQTSSSLLLSTSLSSWLSHSSLSSSLFYHLKKAESWNGGEFQFVEAVTDSSALLAATFKRSPQKIFREMENVEDDLQNQGKATLSRSLIISFARSSRIFETNLIEAVKNGRRLNR